MARCSRTGLFRSATGFCAMGKPGERIARQSRSPSSAGETPTESRSLKFEMEFLNSVRSMNDT